MKRNMDINEVSDGKLYSSNDMVKMGCDDCSGCSDCCTGMGNSIILDPYDIYQLTKNLGRSFDELMDQGVHGTKNVSAVIGLDVVDGVILPHLNMAGTQEKCIFLNQEGRCSIHSFRPGFCRLFPLGRIYENGTFHYFHQVYECKKTQRTKVKINKWLGISNLKKYEQFVLDWHNFLERVGAEVRESSDENAVKRTGLSLLYVFYRKPYDFQRDFYEQFYEKLKQLL